MISIDNGKYVTGCYDGVIYVMDVSTGDLVWSFTTNGQVKCSPVADEKSSLILIGSHDQNLYALSIEVSTGIQAKIVMEN